MRWWVQATDLIQVSLLPGTPSDPSHFGRFTLYPVPPTLSCSYSLGIIVPTLSVPLSMPPAPSSFCALGKHTQNLPK